MHDYVRQINETISRRRTRLNALQSGPSFFPRKWRKRINWPRHRSLRTDSKIIDFHGKLLRTCRNGELVCSCIEILLYANEKKKKKRQLRQYGRKLFAASIRLRRRKLSFLHIFFVRFAARKYSPRQLRWHRHMHNAYAFIEILKNLPIICPG